MSSNEFPHRVGPPQGLVPVVVAGLIDRIHNGEFPAGSAVPTVSVLSDDYGVSRTVIREALRILQEKGLIDTRQGSGTVVRDYTSWNLLDPEVLAAQMRHDSSLERLASLVQIRAAVESEMARSAADHITDAEIEQLKKLLDEFKENRNDPAAYAETDLKFHGLVMAISGNQFGRLIVGTVVTWARSVPRPDEQLPSAIQASYRSHSEVFRRIAAHDSAGAAEAMRRHIMESWGSKLDAVLKSPVAKR
ncbi:MAG: hypothetical protein QOG10_3777 [Kribbellaceae bacterium]|jgi:DNA-binding FadR family transcriptional regulator|nr:hypothetical protein [Kribbellaceae bacterium]